MMENLKNTNKLTSIDPSNISSDNVLTTRVNAPFRVCFGEFIEKKYNLKKYSESGNTRELINFLHKHSGKNWNDVDKTQRCQNDKNDKYKDHDIIHYKISRKGRIHGFISEGLFHIIRIDPNHKFHNK